MNGEVKVNIKVSVLTYGEFIFTENLGLVEESKEEEVTHPPYAFPQFTGPELFSQPVEVRSLV
jgi:hypothetical protein